MRKIKIPVDKVEEGMLIEIPLSWLEHPFLFSKFRVKNKDQIYKIKSLNTSFVFLIEEKEKQSKTIEDQRSLVEALKTPKKERDEPEKITCKTSFAKLHRLKIQKCEKIYSNTLSNIKNLIKSIKFFSEDSVQESREIVQNMVSALLKDSNPMIFLINAQRKQEELFHHSLNTFILGLLLAKAVGVSAELMCNIGLGSIFHDVGKLRIPNSILIKEKPLTKAEKEFLKLHPKFGFELVSKIKSFSEEVRKVILEHHETLDGKGYPKGLRGSQIDICTRIVSIVNIYDNLCNPRIIEKSLTPHKALALMYKKLSGKLDKKLLEVFIKTLGVYPPGTIVKLSNGYIGVVVSKSFAHSMKPNVMIYEPSIPSTNAPVIALDEEKSLDIVETLHPSKLPEEIFEYLNPPLSIGYMLDTLAE